MSTFTPAISCLTTSNLPWFMDLTFQVPMQYYSLQHWTLLLSPVTPTTGCCFCFGSIPSFLLELFLHWSPVACWAPTNLGNSSLSILSFCLFILLMGFSRQECWNGLPFPSLVDHIFQNFPPWPVHLGWPYRAWLIVSWRSHRKPLVFLNQGFCLIVFSSNSLCSQTDQGISCHLHSTISRIKVTDNFGCTLAWPQ